MWEIYSYCVKPWEDLTMLQVSIVATMDSKPYGRNVNKAVN